MGYSTPRKRVTRVDGADKEINETGQVLCIGCTDSKQENNPSNMAQHGACNRILAGRPRRVQKYLYALKVRRVLEEHSCTSVHVVLSR